LLNYIYFSLFLSGKNTIRSQANDSFKKQKKPFGLLIAFLKAPFFYFKNLFFWLYSKFLMTVRPASQI